MRSVEPKVFLVHEPRINWDGVLAYLKEVGGLDWAQPRIHADDAMTRDGETVAEFMGKLCYRSWKPGLNPNVTKVRSDRGVYIENILKSKHGSVLEHVNYGFVFYGVSRVFTHELVRHRAGSAFSQESMRFVRLDDIPFWMPEWAKDDEELQEMLTDFLEQSEQLQKEMSVHFELDSTEGEPLPFHEKKEKTSFMRRFAPDGVATSIGWTANVRTLRHVIEARTAEGAEEEIRLVFDKVANILVEEHPEFFGDFTKDDMGAWIPKWSKV